MSIVRLGHIAFTVADLDRSIRFAEEIVGMRVVDRIDDTAYLSSNSRHHQLRLTSGEEHGCEEIAFDADDFDGWQRLLDKASAAGLEVIGANDDPFAEHKARIYIPDGPSVAVCCGAAAISPARYSTLGVRPLKLGHVTVASPDVEGVGRILTEVLGLRLSDRLPLGEHADGELRWYRCNADHHAIGLCPGEAGVHHYAFGIDSFAAFGVVGDHLLANAITYIWGPGRHGPGDNLFAYFKDADGSMIEFYADMEQIEDETSYKLREWPDVASSANVWGPAPPQEWFEVSTPFVPARTTSAAH